MITKSKSYTTTDGTIHATIEEARQHELLALVSGSSVGGTEERNNLTAEFMVANAEAIIDLLTTTAKSRPAARKSNRKKAVKASEAVAA